MATTSTAAPKPIDDFGLWLSAFTQPTVLTELGALVLCIALALGVTWLMRRALGMQAEARIAHMDGGGIGNHGQV